jgi:hypothetical protein
MTVIRKGREIDITSIHHRRVCAVIDSCLESSAYSAENYIALADTQTQVLIDDRGTGEDDDDVTGTLTIAISQHEAELEDSEPEPYKLVKATVIWNEPEGIETVTIYKGVARL